MPDILDLIEPDTLEQTPPRRLPAFFLPNLIGEYLLELPPTAYLDPFVILCLIAAVALTALGAPPLVDLALIALIGVRLLGPCLRLLRAVREDYLLLRHGLVISAHVIGMRLGPGTGGRPAGAYLDCAIPITRQRTSVGSVWLPDAAAAVRLSTAGRIPVICLAHAPGTWRLCDEHAASVRYEPARM